MEIGSDVMNIKTELNAEMRRVYALAVRRRVVSAEDVSLELRMDEREAGRRLAELLDLRLLHPHTDARCFVAVAPDFAQLGLLEPLVRQMSVIQEQVDRIRAEFGALQPVYLDAEGAAPGRMDGQIEVVSDPDVLRTLVKEFGVRAETEILFSRPGASGPERYLDIVASFAGELTGRDTVLRALYQHAAQFNQGMIAHVEHLLELGGEARTTANGFTGMLVFDRRVAVVPLRNELQGGVVVRSEDVITTLVDAFERTWNAAGPFPVRTSRTQVASVSCEVKWAIMRLLVEGVSDKNIATRVGLSLRTCQRHIADLMQELGARNRLQAGYRMRDLLAGEEPERESTVGRQPLSQPMSV
ncbi:regulatory protein, luxR family [Streptomyces sp. TLI_053]|uniref:helix-turn-helix transcriptional regulator n=1 Tax=Streptomyces sp. TLI_053 TaxID=1855352 RepID=UPI0008798141|nr:LuxR C-terminal-related transcriptional regulator [Streptomyces sp. TLI_053]SDT77280.1 regulatory protein, luxR family [Streptomyces sp. TLI_053]